MNQSTGMVAEFHRTFNHPIAQKLGEETLETRQLRIKLLFEELKELATATGCNSTFHELCNTTVEENHIHWEKGGSSEDHDNVDHVEELDALCDLQVVLDGKLLTSGHWKHFDVAFTEVHRSNMSKACKSADEASITTYEYTNRGVLTYKEQVEEYYVVKRSADNKILKGPNFFEPNLKAIIDENT